jgi:hypothetical protein
MAKFPIVQARQELGFVPTTAVRADIDVQTGEGEVGAAIGQAGLALGEKAIKIAQKNQQTAIKIAQRRQQMLDARSAITADSFITTAIDENTAFRNTNADTTTWSKDLQERLKKAESQISTLDMSEDAQLLVNTKFQAKLQDALGDSLIAETRREKEDTQAAIIDNVVEAYSSGTEQDQKDASRRFLEIAPMLMDDSEMRATLKTAIMAGQKARGEIAISNVHAAMEAGSFEVARELAKNSLIPEPQQTTLRNTINSAEKARTNIIESDSQTAASASVENSYAKIMSGDTNITSMITEIQTDPNILDGDSNIAAVKIRTFFSTWNSAIDKKIVTSNSTRIKALKIIGWVRGGDLTEDEGLEAYKRMAKDKEVNGADGKVFINQIFTAAKSAKDTEAKRRESVLSRREKQVRDAIETQFSLFPPEEIDEILEDFANIAVIHFRDNFDEGDITEGTLAEFKKKVDSEVDDLIRKYRLSTEQQTRAVSARVLKEAETFKAQQDEIIKIISSFEKEGRREDAKAVMEEAVSLGLLDSEGTKGEIKKKKISGKSHLGKAALKRVFDVLGIR